MSLEHKTPKIEHENPEIKRLETSKNDKLKDTHEANALALNSINCIAEDLDADEPSSKIEEGKERNSLGNLGFIQEDSDNLPKQATAQEQARKEYMFSEDVHLQKVKPTEEGVREAIEKLPSTLRLKASLDRSDKDAYISKDEFFAIMKEVIKDPKDQAKLLDGINTVLEKGLHSNAEEKTLNKLVNTFKNASKNGSIEKYEKAANVVSNLLNPKAAALRENYSGGERIKFNYGVDTRPNKFTEKEYRKSSTETTMLSFEGCKQLAEGKKITSFLKEDMKRLMDSPLFSELKKTSQKLFGMDIYSIKQSAVGTVESKKDEKGGSIGGSVVEQKKDIHIVRNDTSVHLSRSHQVLGGAVQYEKGSVPTIESTFATNKYSVAADIYGHTITADGEMSADLTDLISDNDQEGTAKSPRSRSF